jgi:hypothetical protein
VRNQGEGEGTQMFPLKRLPLDATNIKENGEQEVDIPGKIQSKVVAIWTLPWVSTVTLFLCSKVVWQNFEPTLVLLHFPFTAQ